MGMVAIFRRLADEDIATLLAEPELIEEYVDSEEPPDGFGPFANLDVDKAWHAIQFLLTGSAWEGEPPLNFIVAGGTPIGDVDLGYGPARAFSSAEVRGIAAALTQVTVDALQARFAPKALMTANIYPEIWDRPPEEDDVRGYVLENYDSLRQFLLDAAQEGEALLVFIS